MKMKMFVGRTEEEALAMIRAEMGPDAVILSSKFSSKHFFFFTLQIF